MSVTLNAREIHGLIKEKKAFARSKKQEVASWCENFKKVNGKDPSSSDKREIKGMIDEYNAVKREYDELKVKTSHVGKQVRKHALTFSFSFYQSGPTVQTGVAWMEKGVWEKAKFSQSQRLNVGHRLNRRAKQFP